MQFSNVEPAGGWVELAPSTPTGEVVCGLADEGDDGGAVVEAFGGVVLVVVGFAVVVDDVVLVVGFAVVVVVLDGGLVVDVVVDAGLLVVEVDDVAFGMVLVVVELVAGSISWDDAGVAGLMEMPALPRRMIPSAHRARRT